MRISGIRKYRITGPCKARPSRNCTKILFERGEIELNIDNYKTRKLVNYWLKHGTAVDITDEEIKDTEVTENEL